MTPMPFAALPAEERATILARRLQRAQAALATAETALEGRMRELANANHALRQREEDLAERLNQESHQLLAAQRTGGFATIYRRAGDPYQSSSQLNALFGFPDTMVPTPEGIMARVHPLDRERIARAAGAFFAHAAPDLDHVYTHRIVHPELGLRWLKWSIRREDRDGRLYAILGAVHDVTEARANERGVRALQKLAERRVRELDRLARDLAGERKRAEAALDVRTRILSHFAHQFRTPLNSLSGMIDLLSQSARNEEQRASLAFAEHATERLATLVEEALAEANGEGADVTLFTAPADPAALLRNGARFWKTVLADSGEEDRFELTIAGELPPQLELDAVRMRELVDCLIGYGQELGAVTSLEASWDSALVLLCTYHDCDLHDAPLNDRTQPQWRRALFLIDAMGGKIRSTGTGQPLKTRIALPLPISDQSGQSVAQIVSHAGEAPHILLAEDTISNQQIIAALLARMGCTVETVANGQEALEALAAHNFDAVLMDVQMPVMDGETAARHIRAFDGAVSRIPIIGITAHGLQEERERLLAAGMSACLTKPIKDAELRSALTTAMLAHPAGPPKAKVFEIACFASAFEALPPHFRERFLHAVEADFDTYGEALRRAYSEGDAQAAERQAHALKGVAANIGAQALVAALEEFRAQPFANAACQYLAVCEQLAAARAECNVLFAAVVAPQ